MSQYIINKDALHSEVVDKKHIKKGIGNGILQIVERYHLSAKNLALLVWEYLKGFIFTKDRKALKTKDGKIIKCKGQ